MHFRYPGGQLLVPARACSILMVFTVSTLLYCGASSAGLLRYDECVDLVSGSWTLSAELDLTCQRPSQTLCSACPLSRKISTNAAGSVTGLSLQQYNITGTLPQRWSSLTNLKSLELGNNSITGPLPASWSTLKMLTYLSLADNNIIGTFPTSWSTFTQLEVLNLQANNLSGPVPSSWTSLRSLRVLWLNNNTLEADFPNNMITALQKLESVDMMFTNTTGIMDPAWSALTALQYLNVRRNPELSGTLPDEWTVLNRLTYLDLRFNNLTGTLPDSWRWMTNLQGINLRNTKLMGTLPASWSGLAGLMQLNISDCYFTGTLPAEWEALKNLERLDLGRNPELHGTFPASWSGMTAMTTLYLRRSNYVGELPQQWSALTNMKELSFAGSNLTGTLPPEWSTMTALTYMVVGQTRIKGTLPAAYSNLRSLVILLADEAQLTGTLPPELFSPPASLRFVDLAYNKLSGPIPAPLSGNLTMVTLDDNQLEGSLPPLPDGIAMFRANNNNIKGSLPALPTSLIVLALGNNSITGVLPELPPNLSILDTSHNQLSGAIPTLPASLAFLNLADNQFQSMEWDLEIMGDLQYLSVAVNNLSGTLPPTAPSQLGYANFSRNALRGSIPSAWLRNYWHVLDLSYNQLTGSLPRVLTPSPQMEATSPAAGYEKSKARWALDSYIELKMDPNVTKTTASSDSTPTAPNPGQTGSHARNQELPRTVQAFDVLKPNSSDGDVDTGGEHATSEVGHIDVLSLRSNKISGSLPVHWSTNSSLIVLDLMENRLGGRLPSTWSLDNSFGSLNYMALRGNEFKGGVPIQWVLASNTFKKVKLILGLDLWYRYKHRGLFSAGANWMEKVCTNKEGFERIWSIPRAEIDSEVILAPVREVLEPLLSELVSDLYNSMGQLQKGFETRGSGYFADRVARWIELPTSYFEELNAEKEALSVAYMCDNQKALAIVLAVWVAVFVTVVIVVVVYMIMTRWHDDAMEQVTSKPWWLAGIKTLYNMKRSPESGFMARIKVVGHVVGAALYWADIVTDILVTHSVWGSWPGYVFLTVLIVQYTYAGTALAITILKHHRSHLAWLPMIAIGLIPSMPVLDTVASLRMAHIHIPFVHNILDWEQYHLFRQVTETLLEAIPCSVLQSVVFVLGNSPHSKLYLDAWIFIPSIIVSGAVVIKSAFKFMWTCLDESKGMVGFFGHSVTAQAVCYQAPATLPDLPNLSRSFRAVSRRIRFSSRRHLDAININVSDSSLDGMEPDEDTMRQGIRPYNNAQSIRRNVDGVDVEVGEGNRQREEARYGSDQIHPRDELHVGSKRSSDGLLCENRSAGLRYPHDLAPISRLTIVLDGAQETESDNVEDSPGVEEVMGVAVGPAPAAFANGGATGHTLTAHKKKKKGKKGRKGRRMSDTRE